MPGESVPQSGCVLQDVANEFGSRLDFEAENGLYAGKRNAIGFDGIWRSSDEPEIVVEVKTSDAYTVRLETIYGYKEELVKTGKVSRSASILIVVGRKDTDTEALDAQVRGSRFARDIRLISVDSLIKLVQIKEKSDDPATVILIRKLLHPFEYTTLDRIIDVIFTTAADVEQQQEEEQEEKQESANGEAGGRQSYADPALLNAKRQEAISAFSRLQGKDLIKRSRTFFWSADKKLRVCCTVSKRYEGDHQPYWYAYHRKWDSFLSEGQGFLILCCMDLDWAFAVPQAWFAENKQNLYTTERPNGTTYWNISLTTLPDGSIAINLNKIGKKYNLDPHKFRLRGT